MSIFLSVAHFYTIILGGLIHICNGEFNFPEHYSPQILRDQEEDLVPTAAPTGLRDIWTTASSTGLQDLWTRSPAAVTEEFLIVWYSANVISRKCAKLIYVEEIYQCSILWVMGTLLRLKRKYTVCIVGYCQLSWTAMSKKIQTSFVQCSCLLYSSILVYFSHIFRQLTLSELTCFK